ncbi:hypothetical protein [Ignicoccus hospitalis]|uniref:Uncharacterized protein n=1 Tax=Ignicoccus hospitalis (strain KIN4/I / DSM 18386 / JCM 14125) TaxID=453591 RepID=A8AAH5_IGNH4|nr:hypothetical protein [Ignicoccus hospitalis]ABU81927.1 hypothetical protein Igni_0745 [Ignicoccus hospitalis KIN4/I]HIH89914.1 hypothetical protein [Desulfurococcaceae archaeon]
MIIVAVGADSLINKLKREVEEVEKELADYGNALSVVMDQGRKELVRYKLLGFKTKPPEKEVISEKPLTVLHRSLLVFSKDFEREVASTFKEYKEEIQSLIDKLNAQREEFKDHIFFVFTKGAKIVAIYVLPPTVPGYETIRAELERLEGGR